MSIFNKIFTSGRPTQRGTKRYDEEKEMVQSTDMQKRLALAESKNTNQEILYYLADHDPEPEVRMAVLQNDALPLQASLVLAKDASEDVRLSLAERLVNLLPDIHADQHSRLYAYVVQALADLALDEVLKVRKALASTLKDHAYTPPKIATQLARDIEREVSEPILRFCTALPDETLLDILKEHPADWVVETVAARDIVSEDVSEAVIELEHQTGGKILLENEGAHISASLLHYIVEKARSFPEWQAPMVMRKKLPEAVAREMAEFVDEQVYELLINRDDFNEETTKEIGAIFRRRVDFSQKEQRKSAKERLEILIAQDAVGEEAVSDALAMRDYPFLNRAMAYLSGIERRDVKRVFATKAAKPIVALAWKAGLSMRMALRLQQEIGHVQPKELVYPKGGTHYPLSEKELNWQLEFMGIIIAEEKPLDS